MREDAEPPGGRMSTITDVAREAGVSVATVSRALRGLDRVSEDTRKRVLAVARELSYVASPTATSLASGRTRVIAVMTPFLSRWFFSSLVSAIEKTLRIREHHVLLFDLEAETYDQRLHLTQNMLWKRVDGLISLNLPFDEGELALLRKLDLPVVAVGTPVPGRPLVSINDAEAIDLAVDHLVGLGHTRIAYVGVVPDTVVHILTPRIRLQAFHERMHLHGLASEKQWILSSDWTAGSAARDARVLLASPHRPTAVVAASDEIAFGVMEAARRAGLRVPEDLSVTGVDDHSLAEVFGLTTVRQDVAAQGHRAAELLLGMVLDGVAEADVPPLSLLPVELVVRSSTGPAPA